MCADRLRTRARWSAKSSTASRIGAGSASWAARVPRRWSVTGSSGCRIEGARGALRGGRETPVQRKGVGTWLPGRRSGLAPRRRR
ncbi:hypothetical protein Nm8I071_53470 [Nonomuraea sp. TT08I-71]|nr:hypothetical protein Nm8I071_53470 [Nonomuraea sp. TT08I-71]